jgi:hypothetical protein
VRSVAAQILPLQLPLQLQKLRRQQRIILALPYRHTK